VTPTRIYQSKVVDRVSEEWCEFDEENVAFDGNRTFEWWLAHQLRSLVSRYPSLSLPIENLKGVLYDGELVGGECKIRLRNEIRIGTIVSNAILVRTDKNGKEIELDLGTMFDMNLQLAENMVLRGT
jgi:hypothetical protein